MGNLVRKLCDRLGLPATFTLDACRHGWTFGMTVPPTTQPLPSRLEAFSYLHRGATWRSGYATVCKTVYSGSIPDVASTISMT